MKAQHSILIILLLLVVALVYYVRSSSKQIAGTTQSVTSFNPELKPTSENRRRPSSGRGNSFVFSSKQEENEYYDNLYLANKPDPYSHTHLI